MSSVSKKPSVLLNKTQASVKEVVSVQQNGPPCKGRSTAKFLRFIGKDPSKINILLARALLHDDLLDSFDGHPHASECAFSYPNSDWYSVYLLDEEGNKVWNPEEGHMKLYFKIKINRDGTDASIIEESMTNETPSELLDPVTGMEIANCVVSGSSCTGSLPKVVKTKEVIVKEVKPRGRPSSKAKVPELIPSLVSPSIVSGLEDLTITEASTSKKVPEKITREFFEGMKSKAVIVDWMLKNMDRSDLVKCIQKGALSAAEVSEAESLADVEVPEVSEEVIRAAESMPVSEFKKMLKRVSKDSIKESLPKDSAGKKQAIAELCMRSGIPGYSVKAVERRGKTSYVLYDGDSPVTEDDEINVVIDECAEKESERLKTIIDRLRKRYARSEIISEARRRKLAVSDVPIPATPVEAAAVAVTLDSIISEIMAIGDSNDKKKAIVDLCMRSGNTNYSVKAVERRGKTSYVLYDGDSPVTEEDEINEILNECAQIEFTRLNQGSSSFGKKMMNSHQKKFKSAARKCKGKKNYIKCMSKSLKKKN
jgi:uncharacterized protein YpmB